MNGENVDGKGNGDLFLRKNQGKCKFKNTIGNCVHKNNQEKGRSRMKCIEKGCPEYSPWEDNQHNQLKGGQNRDNGEKRH